MKLRILHPLAFAVGLAAAHGHAAEPVAAPALPTADIAVDASRTAPNDQFRAQVYFEATDANTPLTRRDFSSRLTSSNPKETLSSSIAIQT